jgi:hypothetical protein
MKSAQIRNDRQNFPAATLRGTFFPTKSLGTGYFFFKDRPVKQVVLGCATLETVQKKKACRKNSSTENEISKKGK